LSKIATIDPAAPDPAVIHQAVDILQKGGLLVVPTRHLYGLGVDALNPQAVARVFAAKQRPLHQPLLILVATQTDVCNYARGIDGRATALMDTFWPGKVTIVLEARSILPMVLTGGTGRIGIRVPGHPVCRDIVGALSGPLTATSANLSGQPGCHRIEDLHPDIAAAADFVLDAGPLQPGLGSTVVDIRPSAVHILREGAVAASDILNALSDRGMTQ
jgi:L-threonylcarbamoyladenylate synthase